jgi:hypothetical protein
MRPANTELARKVCGLEGASDSAIERFAWAYGPLGINLFTAWVDIEPEPLSMWRGFAHDLGVLVRMSGETTFGDLEFKTFDLKTVERDKWPLRRLIAKPDGPFRECEPSQWDSHRARNPFSRNASMVSGHESKDKVVQFLEGFADWWLGVSPSKVELRFGANNGRSIRKENALQVTPPNLNAALAIQFTQSVTVGHGLVLCSGCHEFFDPLDVTDGRRARAPNPNRRSWCDPCRSEGAPAKHRKRDQRSRRMETSK